MARILDVLSQTRRPRHALRLDHEERFQIQRLNHLLRRRSIAQAPKAEEQTDRDFGMKLDGPHLHFRSWRNRPEFAASAYDWQGGRVVYRGLTLENGDVILCNRARSSDGMFTTLVEGRQSFAHVAVYVSLRHHGSDFPSVIEIHHEGVRAVPLRVFMSVGFTTYAEIYRSQSLTPQIRERSTIEARKMIEEPHGFDISMDESQERYLSCALMAALLLRRSGGNSIRGQSRYSPLTAPNLKILGNSSELGRDLLMPDDYSRSPEFSLVGCIDNDRFIELVARALVRERMFELWTTRTLDPKRFPRSTHLNRAAVWCAQLRLPLISTIPARAAGFTRTSFPSGPLTFISLVPEVESRVERASDRLAETLRKMQSTLFSVPRWEDLVSNAAIRDETAAALAEFESLFQKRESDPLNRHGIHDSESNQRMSS